MSDVLFDKDSDSEYRAHLSRGELRMQCCDACGLFRNPPRFACPRCLSREWQWRLVCGRGVVETFLWYCEAIDPRFSDVPYNVALVRLEEGPGVFANVADASIDDLRVGRAVIAAIGERDGRPQLRFVTERGSL